MKVPELHRAESARLSALRELAIVYSPAEERFDRITRLARRFFNVPIALVSLVNERCQWFKSAQGLDVGDTGPDAHRETPREISFCGHAIFRDDTFVVRDAANDPDFADNPLVTGEPYIRFYAGHPIRYRDLPMGTLCIIDRKPRLMSAADYDTLRSLAAWASTEIAITALSEEQRQLFALRDDAMREIS